MEPELSVREVPERLSVDAESLRLYLQANLPAFSCAEGALRVRQFSHGESNPTYHLLTSSGQDYVLRRRPPGKLLPGAHRVCKILREKRVYKRLQAQVQYKVQVLGGRG